MCLVLNIPLCKAVRYCSSPWLPSIQTNCKLILGKFFTFYLPLPPSLPPYAINSHEVYCSCCTNENPDLWHVYSFFMVLLKYMTEFDITYSSSLTPAFPRQYSAQPWGSVGKCWWDQKFLHLCSWKTWPLTQILLIHHSNICAVPAGLLQQCLNSVLAGNMGGRMLLTAELDTIQTGRP